MDPPQVKASSTDFHSSLFFAVLIQSFTAIYFYIVLLPSIRF